MGVAPLCISVRIYIKDTNVQLTRSWVGTYVSDSSIGYDGADLPYKFVWNDPYWELQNADQEGIIKCRTASPPYAWPSDCDSTTGWVFEDKNEGDVVATVNKMFNFACPQPGGAFTVDECGTRYADQLCVTSLEDESSHFQSIEFSVSSDDTLCQSDQRMYVGQDAHWNDDDSAVSVEATPGSWQGHVIYYSSAEHAWIMANNDGNGVVSLFLCADDDLLDCNTWSVNGVNGNMNQTMLLHVGEGSCNSLKTSVQDELTTTLTVALLVIGLVLVLLAFGFCFFVRNKYQLRKRILSAWQVDDEEKENKAGEEVYENNTQKAQENVAVPLDESPMIIA